MKHMVHRNTRLNLKWKTSAFNKRNHRMAPDDDWILNHLEIRSQIHSEIRNQIQNINTIQYMKYRNWFTFYDYE